MNREKLKKNFVYDKKTGIFSRINRKNGRTYRFKTVEEALLAKK